MKLKIAALIFIVMLFTQCKSQQYSLQYLPVKHITFGKGGGITGAIDMYILLENGQIFHKNSLTKEEKEMTRISKKKARSFFEQLDGLEIQNMRIDQPGNIYFFIEEINSKSSNKIVWGSMDYEVDLSIQKFYNNLLTLLK